MRGRVVSIIDGFVPDGVPDDEVLGYRLFASAMLLVIGFGSVLLPGCWFLVEDRVSAVVLAFTGAGIALLLPLVRRTRDLALGTHLFCAIVTAACMASALAFSGIDDPGLVWLACVPAIAALLGGRRAAVLWAGVGIAGLFGLYTLESSGLYVPSAHSPEAHLVAGVLCFGSALLLLLALGLTHDALHRQARAELSAAHVQLARTREQALLADRMASVGTLAAGVAHEINNPLTWMLTNVEYLRRHVDGRDLPELDEVVGELRDGVVRVRDIVSQLRGFSRADPERTGPVDLRPVVEKTLRIVANELRHRATVTVEVDDVPPVEGNESLLGQVLLNLVVNAVGAFDRDAVDENRVEVRVFEVAGEVVLQVDDNGPGVPPALRTRIFEPFFTTRAVGEGTGLGLAVCRNVVTRYGGRIEVGDAPVGGARFRVVLPASALPDEPTDATEDIPAQAPRTTRVLVVDDEALVARALSRVLRRGHEVEVCTDARQALERLRSASFDAVLCDVMMPGLTGPDLYQQVVADAPEMASRFVFMTGGAFTARAREALSGMDRPCLSKPIAFDELAIVVARAAEGGSPGDEAVPA